MAAELIVRERREDVALLTLNRPEKLNAWTPQMADQLSDAVEDANRDDQVGAIVVTGAGRGFCAGADMGAVFDAQIKGDGAAAEPGRARDWVELVRSSKPIVAAVNGACIGVGLTMILPFDRMVVAEEAKLSIRFVKLGVVPELASTMYLPLRCGWGAASDLMLSGRTVLGDEAVALGLADELAPVDQVVEVAVARARSYAENPPQALRWIKELLSQNASETDARVVQRREITRVVEGYQTPEHAEAVAAFLEGRPPRFR